MNDYWKFVKGNIVDTDIEEIIQIIKSESDCDIFLTVPELKELEERLNSIDKIKLRFGTIFLYLNSPTELSYTEYKKLHEQYRFYHLFVQGFSKMRFDEDYFDSSDIDPNIMMIYLKKSKN